MPDIENEHGETHDSTITERAQTRRELLLLLNDGAFKKQWQPKRLAQEVWALCKELRVEYKEWEEFWGMRSRAFRRIRSGEIEGYDYGLIYFGLKLFLEKHAPNKSEDTVSEAGSHPRSYAKNTLSAEKFSEGLRESLRRYNDELRYLTIEQVKALEDSQKHCHLWIQGPAGTGKTIFAVEAAYRALRAGLSVLIVYRSRQFEQVFSRLLADVGKELKLLLHLDFMYLLRLIETRGIDSDEFINAAGELLEVDDIQSRRPLFDLMIIDDCGTYEIQMPSLMKHASELAYRKIFLAAPDQILGHIVLDAPYSASDQQRVNPTSIHSVLAQKLEAPDGYHCITLTKNMRNAGAIVRHANEHLGVECEAGIRESGKVQTVSTHWVQLHDTLLKLCSEALKSFPPHRIKILVDPFLEYPGFSDLSNEEYCDQRDEILESLPPLTQAVLIAAQDGHFLHSTFECDEEDLAAIMHEYDSGDTYFIYTDGEEIGALAVDDFKSSAAHLDIENSFNHWTSPHVDAKEILSENALLDPLQTVNAICIYSTPLFIGLESDVVIYIRSKQKMPWMFASIDILEETEAQFERVLSNQHYLAASRAKYYYYEVSVLGVL